MEGCHNIGCTAQVTEICSLPFQRLEIRGHVVSMVKIMVLGLSSLQMVVSFLNARWMLTRPFTREGSFCVSLSLSLGMGVEVVCLPLSLCLSLFSLHHQF
jgi:hypothetical protein